MHVLFVDDDEVLAQGVETALRDKGHVCEVAQLGKQAVTLSKEKAYDIVVLDVGLPDIDGCQVVRLMKVEGVETPVLLQSGLADPTLPAEMEALGVNGFLAKPFSIAELIERMEAVLAGRGFAAPEATPPVPPARPQPAPRKPPGSAGPTAGSKPEAEPAPRPSAVAEARAALRALPEEPTPLQTVAKCGAGVVSKAVTTARSAMATTMEAGSRLLPDPAPAAKAAGGAKAVSKFAAKARGALGGEALSKAMAKAGALLGTDPRSKTVAKVRSALAGEPATPPEPEADHGLPGEAVDRPQAAETGARPAGASDAAGDPVAGPAAAAPGIPAAGPGAAEPRPRLEAEDEIEATPAASEPPQEAPGTEAESDDSPDGSGHPELGVEADAAPDDLSQVRSETDLEMADELEAASPDPEPAQDAPWPEAELDDAPDMAGGPEAGLEVEPASDDPTDIISEPDPETADEIEEASPDPGPLQDAPWPEAERDDTPDMAGGPEAALDAEPAPEDLSAILSGPDLEAEEEIEPASPDLGPPQDAPWPEAEFDDAPDMPGGPEAELEAEPAPEDLSAVLSGPDLEADEEIEPASPDPGPPQDAPWPEAERDDAADMPGGPEAALEAEPAPGDPIDIFAGPGPAPADENEAASPAPELPRDAPRPETGPGPAPAVPGESETAFEPEAVPDVLSATPFAPEPEPGLEPQDELRDEVEYPSRAPEQPGPWPVPELDTEIGAGPESAGDRGAAGEAPSGDEAGSRSDGRSPLVEPAVIVDGNKHHACVILERSERGAALRLYHPERDLPDAFTLRPLKGSEHRCVQSWRKDDKIGVEFL